MHTQIATDPKVTPRFKPEPEDQIIDRMARAMVESHAHGGAHIEAMHDAGFSDLELSMYGTQARQRAKAIFVREEPEPTYSRAERIAQGSDLLAGLINWPGLPVITSQLLARGFRPDELDDILPDIITTTADRFAAEAGAQ